MIEQLDDRNRDDLTTYLAQFVTAHKQARIAQVLTQRTRYLTVVLEDIFQPHNASAVLRSCECFGVQDVHLLQNYNTFRPNKHVVMGATQWLTLHHYRFQTANNTQNRLEGLRAQGFAIAAATLRPDSIPIQELNLDRPLAICFGTEEEGLSEDAHQLADTFVKIPMHGFTQSFNISVTAALFLHELSSKRRPSTLPWQLTAAEKKDLTLRWYMQIIRNGDLIARNYLAERQQPPSL